MTHTEKEILAKTEADIRNNPLSNDEDLNVKSVLDLDIEIASIRKILLLKEASQKDKIHKLNAEEAYVYNLKSLRNNIVKNSAVRDLNE